MQEPGVFLRNLVERSGYDSCHRTEEYDAQQCYEDCQKQEMSQFAEKCRKDGGLYKCCIRLCFNIILSNPIPTTLWPKSIDTSSLWKQPKLSIRVLIAKIYIILNYKLKQSWCINYFRTENFNAHPRYPLILAGWKLVNCHKIKYIWRRMLIQQESYFYPKGDQPLLLEAV